MADSRRDRQLGAGYDYQWDVALYFLLEVVVLGRKLVQPAIEEALAWLGPVTGIVLEGEESTHRLEDLKLISGPNGRELLVQVKESDEDTTESAWRPSNKKFRDFMARTAWRSHNPDRRCLFLTSGTFHNEVRQLIGDSTRLFDYHDKFPSERPLPAIEAAVANWLQVDVCEFIRATPVDDEVASAGIGAAIINLMSEIGVADPHEAYVRLHHQVARWSFRQGGTRLADVELCEEIRQLLGLSTRAPGSRLPTLIEESKRNPHNFPSWEQLEQGTLWLDDPVAGRVQDQLRETRFALIVGGRGSGKTVISRIVAHRLFKERRYPLYWDFEHRGDLPHPVAELWQCAIATARIHRMAPILLFENVHLQPAVLANLLGQLSLEPSAPDSMMVLATSRLGVEVGESMQPFLDAASRQLQPSLVERGESIVAWWLRQEHQLQGTALARAYGAVQWPRFYHDLVVLRMALEAFDPASGSVITEQIEAMLEGRLRRTIAAMPGIDELLYLVSALGRCALAADLRSLAEILDRDHGTIRAMVERAACDGLLSVGDDWRTCRFWHDSLAQAYWDVFRLRRLDWADRLRARLRIAS